MKQREYEELMKIFNESGNKIQPTSTSLPTQNSKSKATFTMNRIMLTLEEFQTEAPSAVTKTTAESNMDIIQELSLTKKQFNKNHATILSIKKKLATVCTREVKRSLSKTSKINPVLKSKKIIKELAVFDKKARGTIMSNEKQVLLEKRRLEEVEEENRQKRKFNYLLNQTEAFANYFLKRTTDNQEVEGIKAAKRQLEHTKDFTVKKTKKTEDGAPEEKPENLDPETPENAVTAELDQEQIEVYVHQEIEQPENLNCTLKEYQVKGLNWLVSLYNQGINGILADDMGLGKTVQSIALLAYLQAKGINGPFLVVTPTSTLHNWSAEFENFLPKFKVVEYWGGVNERKEKRKRIKNSNVLITSYQLALSDITYLKKIKFQYMILDEAQAIKNNASLRWKNLLQFKARNRLLLTGTPIQNSMAELWALLHFIMPTLFDSVAEFSEWFSKEIESNKVTEEQVNKLHTILKPFMLRRHKNDIKDELGSKEIVHVYCDLSIRQRILYDEIVSSKLDYENIMMHLKKVCNHPDLFEKQEPHSGLVIGLSSTNKVIDRRSTEKLYIGGAVKDDRLDKNGINPDVNEIITHFTHLRKIGKTPENAFYNEELSKRMFRYKLEQEDNEIITEVKRRRHFDEMMAKSFVFRPEKCHLNFFSNNIELEGESLRLKPQISRQPLLRRDLIQTYPLNTFINDSGKLKLVDDLLTELKKNNHRVLVYFQMTRMMDLFEEFLIEKQYQYLRLDGSCKISHRKSIVNEWQKNDDNFVFILSTRAGGVGLNLTAADTVVFYDSDWNPTVDQQAMDRVHRLGQTKDVTVYRLITRNSIEERIMEMAEKKGDMQKLVIKDSVFRGQ